MAQNALMSNVVAISEMLQEVEINEENTKRAISEASQAGNDILVKVEELKEMTTLAVEENNKVLHAIVFYERSNIFFVDCQIKLFLNFFTICRWKGRFWLKNLFLQQKHRSFNVCCPTFLKKQKVLCWLLIR